MVFAQKRQNGFDRFINFIERAGNKLPHPFWLFIILILITMVISAILSNSGISATYLKASKVAGEAPKETTVVIQNLLSRDYIRSIFTNFTSIYTGFLPLGLAIIMLMSLGVTEKSGMLPALMRKTLLSVPDMWVIAILAFVGVNANMASDAGVIITAAVGGAIFKALGRHPWLGIIAGYAASNGGFTANVFLAGTDALMYGITDSVVQSLGINAPVHILMNWFFMFVSSFALTAATVFVAKMITEKHLGDSAVIADSSELKKHTLTEQETKGLKASGIAALLYVLLIVVFTVPQGSVFRADDGSMFPKSPLLSSMISLLFFLFMILGISYGKVAGTIKNAADVPKLMAQGLSEVLSFIVMALPASMFIQFFADSNIGTIIGVKGGMALQYLKMNGLVLLFFYILFVMFIDLFLSSGSAKWMILAPVFIPMFTSIGFSPALTQVAYRIADSCANIISPLDYTVPIIMGMLDSYKTDPEQKVGMGTVFSMTIPYTIAYFAVFFILLVIWYIFKLPLGPGVPIFMQ